MYLKSLTTAVFVMVASISNASTLEISGESVTTSRFVCSSMGYEKILISGHVVFKHPKKEEVFTTLDNDKEILVNCDKIHFEDGSKLSSSSNIRIIVDDTLSGAVHVESTRGVTGYDALPQRLKGDLSEHKAPNGKKGLKGENGRNATSPLDGNHSSSPGENGREGDPGHPGEVGSEGSPGNPGSDAGNIHIATQRVAEGTTVRLAARGGDGGAGGRGGRGEDGGDGGQGGQGGKGGDAAISRSASRGGDGGDGGQGGAGGNGGAGGAGGDGGQGGLVYFYIVEEGGRLAEAPKFDLSGGLGGFPGIGGAEGLGGKGGSPGAPGFGGFKKDADVLGAVTVGMSRLTSKIISNDTDGLAIQVQGEGDPGFSGEFGKKGPDGRPGAIGNWGNLGQRGKNGEWAQGNVSMADYKIYRLRNGL